MYVVGHKPDPLKLTIKPPAGWKIVNGRTDHPGQTEWQFPNWDVMIDTPTEIAPDWTQDTFTVDGKKYHVVVHSFGPEGGKRPALVRDIEKIVRAQVAMWGPPEFEEYTFLIHFAADDHSGDGMEHLTSTQIIEPGALAEAGVYERMSRHSLARVLSRLERQETSSERTWTMGLHAASQHARTLGRGRIHKLLRPFDVETLRHLGRCEILKTAGANYRTHRERAGKQVDERGRVVAVGAVYR